MKPIVTIDGDVTADFTLSCDRTYKITGEVFVQPPAVLTIQPGTTVFGDKVTGAALVIRPGAKIHAQGEPDNPIVFTSEGGQFADPGDWGGLVILGDAPINSLDSMGNEVQTKVEGIVNEANAYYGGQNADDNSGILSYVRVEYGGKAIAPNNELNGITFGGVGRGTKVDHVMVRQTTDDCFEFFGGTVDASHLICQAPGDDGFDWDLGYVGRLQFLVLQQDVSYPTPGDMNGFEGDNDAASSANVPISEPTIYNATLCGQDYSMPQQYGALLRHGTRAHILNTVISGFEAAVDIRDGDGTGAGFEIRGSVFFDNTQVAYPEDQASPYGDDDSGFNEAAWLSNPANANSVADVGITGCDDMNSLSLVPSAQPGNAVAPPADGFFDPTAIYAGAFRDADDTWAMGSWVVWAPN
ncbi:MAG: hypothetical protein HOV80_08055 [Polyangiaceae bacterium]|nr:hypothetical protein [Polyangiaceae bacterium]